MCASGLRYLSGRFVGDWRKWVGSMAFGWRASRRIACGAEKGTDQHRSHVVGSDGVAEPLVLLAGAERRWRRYGPRQAALLFSRDECSSAGQGFLERMSRCIARG